MFVPSVHLGPSFASGFTGFLQFKVLRREMCMGREVYPHDGNPCEECLNGV